MTEDPDPTWDEALAAFEAAKPVKLIRPHDFEPGDTGTCWCGKGRDHLIHATLEYLMREWRARG